MEDNVSFLCRNSGPGKVPHVIKCRSILCTYQHQKYFVEFNTHVYVLPPVHMHFNVVPDVLQCKYNGYTIVLQKTGKDAPGFPPIKSW